jgi:hypothetical protein
MKKKTIIIITALTLSIMLFAANGFADIPAPPVNQTLGFPDVSIGSLDEADCRTCHWGNLDDRHHLLYGSVIPSLSVVPYPDANDTIYVCLSCHDTELNVVTDCTECHNTSSPHHQNALADAGNCVACHGDLVDNMDDGHYIPTYAPSLVTPKITNGVGEPLNSRGNGAGACNYCHDNDGQPTPVILTNLELHHGINLVDFGSRCGWCHDSNLPFEENIRTCEGCHGPDSLHNIQSDSNGGGVVVGGEDYGYGHVGRDNGPGDSDCWGCHGDYALRTADAERYSPSLELTTPYLSGSDKQVLLNNVNTRITLSGSALTNISGTTKFESVFTLTAQDGSVIVLTPEEITNSTATLIIPGDRRAGNYELRAAKGAVFTWTTSNPLSISIKEPPVIWVQSVSQSCGECSGELKVWGTGFGIAPEGSEASINVMQNGVPLEITSWTGRLINATGADCDGSEITVNSLFGSATK